MPSNRAKRARECAIAAAARQSSKKQNKRTLVHSVLHRRLTIDEKRSAPPLVADDTLLDAFAFPFSADQFRRDIYRRHCLVINNGGLERFAEVLEGLDQLDLCKMLESTPSENIFAWLHTASGDNRLSSIEIQSPKHAMTCFEAGASLYFRAPQSLTDAYVTAMSKSIGLNFAGFEQPPYCAIERSEISVEGPNVEAQDEVNVFEASEPQVKSEIETFVSRAGHITEWHTDFMENFTLQLKGVKRWRLKRGNITHPLRGVTPHYRDYSNAEQQVVLHRMQNANFEFMPSEEFFVPVQQIETDNSDNSKPMNQTVANTDSNIVEIELHPGDILYFPAGTWHRVETVEDSISINMSFVGETWADLTADALKQYLWRNSTMRSLVCIDSFASKSVLSPGATASANDIVTHSVARECSNQDAIQNTWSTLQNACLAAQRHLCTILQPRVLCPRAILSPRFASLDCRYRSTLEALRDAHGGASPIDASFLESWPQRLLLNPVAIMISKISVPHMDHQEGGTDSDSTGVHEGPESPRTITSISGSSSDSHNDEFDPEETPPNCTTYIGHFNFGGVDMHPRARVVFHACTKTQAPMMNYLTTLSDQCPIYLDAQKISKAIHVPVTKNYVDLPTPIQLLLQILQQLDMILLSDEPIKA